MSAPLQSPSQAHTKHSRNQRSVTGAKNDCRSIGRISVHHRNAIFSDRSKFQDSLVTPETIRACGGARRITGRVRDIVISLSDPTDGFARCRLLTSVGSGAMRHCDTMVWLR